MGTIDRSDDTIAAFSSRGPTAVDGAAKPDLVAPGVGIESLSDPDSAMYSTQSSYLLPGLVPTTYLPYLSQSGTSMSAPVVSGTAALMFQANPSLTPNQVKAILQYTAQINPDHDPLTEGAGFLNAKGAVELARYFAAGLATYPSSADWGRRIIWGNKLVTQRAAVARRERVAAKRLVGQQRYARRAAHRVRRDVHGRRLRRECRQRMDARRIPQRGVGSAVWWRGLRRHVDGWPVWRR